MSATATATRASSVDPAAERREIVGVARELAVRELVPRAAALDERRPEALEEAWERIRDVGFDRALLGSEQGGAGLGPATLLPCLEEIAVGDGGMALLVLLANAALAAMPPELVAGLGAAERWALLPAPPTELPTGSRLRNETKRGRTKLEGALSPALGALDADGFVVVDGAGLALTLPANADGIVVEADDAQLGLRAAGAARVSFSDVTAGTAPADSGATAQASLRLLHDGVVVIARGIARRAQAMALEYATVRIQGGVPIVEHDAVRDMLAAMAVRLAGSAPSPYETDAETAAAKIAAADAAVATTIDAVQVFGGTGYMCETGVEKLMRDAKTLQRWPEPSWIASGRLIAPPA